MRNIILVTMTKKGDCAIISRKEAVLEFDTFHCQRIVMGHKKAPEATSNSDE